MRRHCLIGAVLGVTLFVLLPALFIIGAGSLERRFDAFPGRLLRETGTKGTVIAIENLMPCKNGRPLLYGQFLTNVVRTGMQDLIVPLPQTSEHAAMILSRLGIPAGLIHIDAANEFDPVMRDVRTYW